LTSTLARVSKIEDIEAGTAFDGLAEVYDEIFTNSLVGRAQRDEVWRTIERIFTVDDRILELNCGTGEDALFMAKRGNTVFACDASMQMIVAARQRLSKESSALPVEFCHMPIERIGGIVSEKKFDGVLSNFSGLNCVADLREVAANLSQVVRDGGKLLLCLSTRFCLAEMIYYLAQGNTRKAFRRCGGKASAVVGGIKMPIYYPTLRQLRKYFEPYFVVKSYSGVGVAIPPSYCEGWARRHDGLFEHLRSLERKLASVPLLRVSGDHILIRFEKVAGQ